MEDNGGPYQTEIICTHAGCVQLAYMGARDVFAEDNRRDRWPYIVSALAGGLVFCS